MDDNIVQLLKSIIGYSPDELKREQGDFQFTDVAFQIGSLHKFANDLLESADFFSGLPDNLKNNLASYLKSLDEHFSQIHNFKPTDIQNPQAMRENISTGIRNIYSNIYEYINKLELFKLRVSGKQADLSNITDEARKTLANVKETQKSLHDIVETTKKTASRVPLYKYLGIFSRASKNHLVAAYIFGILAILIAGVLTYILHLISAELSTTVLQLESVQAIFAIVIAKLFFLAVLIYILQQFVRNYMANMHQFVLNKHRENSLMVFDAMLSTTETKETADQILTQLSKSIFEAGNTGFFPGKDISKDGPDIIQIFKDIGKPK